MQIMGMWALYIWWAILAERRVLEWARYWKREASESRRDKARSMYMDYQKGCLGIPIRHSRLTPTIEFQSAAPKSSSPLSVSCIELPSRMDSVWPLPFRGEAISRRLTALRYNPYVCFGIAIRDLRMVFKVFQVNAFWYHRNIVWWEDYV